MRLAALALICAFAACSRPAPESTPEGALKMWIEKMEAQAGAACPPREAYAMLGPQARANLTERAERASRAQGRRIEPHEMLAQARFGLKFRPRSLKATITGDLAEVRVTGSAPEIEQAVVRFTREGAIWKVEPELMPLASAQKRPGNERD